MIAATTPWYHADWFEAVLYLVIAIVAARVVEFVLARRDRAVTKLLGKPPDPADRTRFVMVRRLIVATILFVGIAVALLRFSLVGDLAKAMLASAAIVAGVIGIAARAPIANLVSGVMIAFSQPVRLRDYISVGDQFGTVERISLTYTFIRTNDGSRVVLPNELFASMPVHNYSIGEPGGTLMVDVTLRLDAGLERIGEVMLEVADGLAPAPTDRANSVEVADVSRGEATMRLHAWAADPLLRRELASDLRAAIVRRLLDEGLLNSAQEVGDGG